MLLSLYYMHNNQFIFVFIPNIFIQYIHTYIYIYIYDGVIGYN
jgi:hypothetical protein